jgi:hypothetical protein
MNRLQRHEARRAKQLTKVRKSRVEEKREDDIYFDTHRRQDVLRVVADLPRESRMPFIEERILQLKVDMQNKSTNKPDTDLLVFKMIFESITKAAGALARQARQSTVYFRVVDNVIDALHWPADGMHFSATTFTTLEESNVLIKIPHLSHLVSETPAESFCLVLFIDYTWGVIHLPLHTDTTDSMKVQVTPLASVTV